ncbi:uncharacterized protein BXZ73DRAFT_102849 [Epithele typhae]|uniref:uncharacterized protein n=1 Tax=Epithele typhae TaxID=378194 RepID=UPI002007AB16|nr:uncharacterized protein BXZ73DRAFT_102849 [Epithele typhae]KAH9926589.1 hypothetical protein BXZ73DRAFT_102849 [Epithele typhae]
MESLPPEVLGAIFALACTDGGFTGCSLALVSTRVRDVVRSNRFHSVQLNVATDRDRLQAFLACFKAEMERTSQSQPRVRHLFLTSGRRSEGFHGSFGAQPSTIERERAEEQAFRAQVLELFALIAKDLYTLTCARIAGHWWYRLSLPCEIGTIEFPLLRELTCDVDVSLCPPLPRLRRVRVAGDVSSQNLLAWATRAPGLTHVWLDCIPSGPRGIEVVETARTITTAGHGSGAKNTPALT